MVQYCTRCGTKKVEDMSFCPMCGRRFETIQLEPDDNPRDITETEIQNNISVEELTLLEKIKNNHLKLAVVILALVVVILAILIFAKMDAFPGSLGKIIGVEQKNFGKLDNFTSKFDGLLVAELEKKGIESAEAWKNTFTFQNTLSSQYDVSTQGDGGKIRKISFVTHGSGELSLFCNDKDEIIGILIEGSGTVFDTALSPVLDEYLLGLKSKDIDEMKNLSAESSVSIGDYQVYKTNPGEYEEGGLLISYSKNEMQILRENVNDENPDSVLIETDAGMEAANKMLTEKLLGIWILDSVNQNGLESTREDLEEYGHFGTMTVYEDLSVVYDMFGGMVKGTWTGTEEKLSLMVDGIERAKGFLKDGQFTVIESGSTAIFRKMNDKYFVTNEPADTGKSIIIREFPRSSWDSAVLYSVPPGATDIMLKYQDYEEVDGDGYTWYEVETPDGQIGYVREDLVQEAQ